MKIEGASRLAEARQFALGEAQTLEDPGFAVAERFFQTLEEAQLEPIVKLAREWRMLDAIPLELRERAQWGVWRRESDPDKPGKPKKVPYCARDLDRRASSTDPATWCDFTAAVGVVGAGQANGVFYAITAEEGLTLVDLDDVRNGDGKMHPAAAAIVAALDTYTEWSQSASGTHSLCRATLPPGRKQSKKTPWGGEIATWDGARFVYLTGNTITGAPLTIEDRQAELDKVRREFLPAPKPAKPHENPAGPADIDDQELLERMFRSRTGGRIEALWNGDTSRYGDDHSDADCALCGWLAFWIGPDPAHIDSLFRRSALMRPKWDERRGESTYGAQTIQTALVGKTDFYQWPAQASERAPSRPLDQAPKPDRRLDDIGNASRFVDQHGDALRYVPQWARWLAYDGRRWAEDELLEPLRCAKLTARALVEEAQREPDEPTRRALLKHAERSAAEPKLRAMLTVASADERIALRPRDFDADPYALNTPSGTVDLNTGTARPHRRQDHLMMLAGAPYDPRALCPMWDAHLRRCLVTDELIAFLQRAAGEAAIGTSREQKILILEGSGSNGKSATRNALAGSLGDYAHQSSLDLLMQSSRGVGHATPELADLRGRRFVTVSESPEDGRLAPERVKAITGSEPITARRLHGNPFTFEPSHSVWLLTNHRPRIRDDGHAIWRRVLLLPFSVTIPEEEQDRNLGDKLAAERAGILRWIVEGAVAYLQGGLNPPDVVLAATRSYREDESTLSGFLADRCVTDPDASEGAADLRRAYNEWAEQNGADTITANALAEKLNARGFERRRPNTGTRWHGIRLTHEGTLDV